LPAMAVYQSTHMPADTPPSLASQLLQGIASTQSVLSEPCPSKIVIYSELARDSLKHHGESHYEH